MRKLIIVSILLSFNLTLYAQSNYFKSVKDNFITTIGCYPKLTHKYGGNHYKCNDDSVKAIYSITVTKVGNKGNLSNADVLTFLNNYTKDLKKNNIFNHKFITYKGLKAIEYTVPLSSYGAWIKQLVLIKFNKSYTLSITAKTKIQVENLMYSFKNNFRFIND